MYSLGAGFGDQESFFRLLLDDDVRSIRLWKSGDTQQASGLCKTLVVSKISVFHK